MPKCNWCGKIFESDKALKQHKIKTGVILVITAIIIIILIFLSFLVLTSGIAA